VHWCFDLYPEAAIADGLIQENSIAAKVFQWLMRRAYASFHLIVDIGGCMRERLRPYGSEASTETIVPWALVEGDRAASVPLAERSELFGDAALGLLYSGNFGRAHSWAGIPELANAMQSFGGKVVFSVRGNMVENLQHAIAEKQAPVEFVGFASSEQLAERLSAADIHIVTLREEWTGTVVPSKFFGALAMGRPVLFVGSSDSAVARWIREFGIGWVLDRDRIEDLAAELARWSASPEAKNRLFRHCHAVYQQQFSRTRALDRWDDALRQISRQANGSEANGLAAACR
jgi:glycosyltransferase involved in cell wall biosynthesis